MKSVKLTNGVNVEIIQTDKFKTDHITVRYMLDLDKDKATARSLLAMMLAARCAKYPTLDAMTQYLDYNYGLNLYMNTFSYGGGHLIDIHSSGVNDAYLPYDSINTQLEIIDEIIFRPLLAADGSFDDSLFEDAKLILAAKIARRDEDPESYALERCSKLFGKDTMFAVSILGSEEDVYKVSKEDVYEAYKDMLTKARVDVSIVSAEDENTIIDKVKAYNFATSTVNSQPLKYRYLSHPEVTEEEPRDIEQSSLILGYHSDIRADDELYYAFKLGNLIIGGDSNSLLFKEIREQHSYCYSIYSTIYSMDGYMLLYAGISYRNHKEVISMMKDIVRRIQNGAFDEELEVAKLLYINGLQSDYDSANGMSTFAYRQELLETHLTLDEVLEKIRMVSAEDVVKAMNTLTYEGSFILREEEVND